MNSRTTTTKSTATKIELSSLQIRIMNAENVNLRTYFDMENTKKKKVETIRGAKIKRNRFFCAMETLSNCCKRTWESVLVHRCEWELLAKWLRINIDLKSKVKLHYNRVTFHWASPALSLARSLLQSLTLSLSPLSALCMFYLIFFFFCFFIRVNICKSTFYGMPSIARKSICT